MPEWSGAEQLWLFGQSWLFGVCLGFAFSVFNVPSRMRSRRRMMVFLCDVLFFALAALATFYFSLATMDGRMHPLLFGGVASGLVMQHLIVGRLLSRMLYVVGRFLMRTALRFFGLVLVPFQVGFKAVLSAVKKILKKIPKIT